ncbi:MULTISPECIES: hypothetical protein [unclassified Methylobacterium]|uniref:hypothetical protein n=1 Tax=unclassified Methylobacterium TaxID=2615210 RepID=UPI001FB88AAE|nr:MULTISPECIES: hypothetical protein [unclassified Methylobacterium]MCJ2020000.1 hypothetical protein [Methylobacterium sp. E-065]
MRQAWGLQRSGPRIQAAVERGVEVARARWGIERDGQFLALTGQSITVRDRSLAGSGTLRRPDMLPPTELRAAIQEVVTGSFGASAEEIVPAVARMLGFKATSAQLREVIGAQIEELTRDGRLTVQGSLLAVASPSPSLQPV